MWPAALSSHTVCRCMVSVKQPFSQKSGYVTLFPNIFLSWFRSPNVPCLFPLVPPAISSKGGMITVVVNEPVRLECEASGVPMPSLTWLKEGRPVSSFSDGIQVCTCGSFDAVVHNYTYGFALYLQFMNMLYQFSISSLTRYCQVAGCCHLLVRRSVTQVITPVWLWMQAENSTENMTYVCMVSLEKHSYSILDNLGYHLCISV